MTDDDEFLFLRSRRKELFDDTMNNGVDNEVLAFAWDSVFKERDNEVTIRDIFKYRNIIMVFINYNF